jgi:hypothetical protein
VPFVISGRCQAVGIAALWQSTSTAGGRAADSPFGGRAFLWTAAGGMRDLNLLVPSGSPYHRTQAVGTNDAGVIPTIGHDATNGAPDHDDHDSPVHFFLLVPGGPLMGLQRLEREKGPMTRIPHSAWLVLVALFAIISRASGQTDPAIVGQWGAVQSVPVEAVHAHVLPTGKAKSLLGRAAERVVAASDSLSFHSENRRGAGSAVPGGPWSSRVVPIGRAILGNQ